MNTDYNKFEYVSSSKKDFNLPSRGTTKSAGYDFYSPIDFELQPNETITINLGVKCSIKEGEFLMLVPRSSVGFNYNIKLWNTVGIIDADYYNNPSNEGEIGLKIQNNGSRVYRVSKNDRILQGIFVKFDITVDDEPRNTKRDGGFGSTGI